MPTKRSAPSARKPTRRPSPGRPRRVEPLDNLLRRALRVLRTNDAVQAHQLLAPVFKGLRSTPAYRTADRLAEAYAVRAHTTFMLGPARSAFRLLRIARKDYPTDARFAALESRMLLQMGRSRAAATAARAALAIAPNVDARLVLAELARRDGRNTEALEQCHAALECDRTRWETYTVLVETLLGLGWTDEALQFLRVAVRRVPRRVRREAWWKLVHTAMPARKYEAAEHALRQLQKSSNERELGEVYVALSEVYGQTQRANDALVCARKALELNPRNLEGLYALLAANVARGSYAAAIRAAATAVEVAPSDPFNRFRLGVLLQQSGNVRGAVEQFQLLQALNPDTPLAEAAAEALSSLDQFQFQQVLMRVSEDSVFRLKLLQNTESALTEYGYVPSLGLLAILRSNEVGQFLHLPLSDKPVRYH